MRQRRFELTVWAFLLSLAYYPDYPGFIAWFALVRPLMIISKLRGGDVFKAAYFFGFCFNLFSLYWIAWVTPPGMITAVLIVALYYAAVLVMFNRIFQYRQLLGLIAFPFLWVGMEYFRTLSQFAFPWSDLGYTQSYYLYILQVVSIISVHGLSFLIAAVNVMLWQVLRKEVGLGTRLACAGIPVGIVVLLIAYGWAVWPYIQYKGEIPVAALQGSVPINVKWAENNEDYSFKLYDSLAVSVKDSAVLVCVWPETAAPAYLTHDYNARLKVGATARRVGVPQFVGAMGAEEKDGRMRYHNSAYLFEPNGSMGPRYDKAKLVPFTEAVPYQDYLPFLRKDVITKYLTFIETYNIPFWSDFSPGDSIKLYQVGDYLFGPLICYEGVFPEYTRQMILDGADFLVNITNDTWWGHSVGIYMHSRFSVVRAVENRCWVVRAANSGWTFIVDDYGEIRHELPLDAQGALVGRIDTIRDMSFFTRHGDVAGRVSFLITALCAAIFIIRWFLGRILRRS